MKRSRKAKKREPTESAESRFQRIYKIIRERICLLEYAPGNALSEVNLAKEFQVSRTPLRRVLQRLEFDGLVDIRNGVGTIVTHINLKTLKDTYDLRIRHALMMGELSPAPIAPLHRQDVEKLIRRLQRLHSSRQETEYARIANDFHELLLQLIGNEPLMEITDLHYYRVARVWLSFLPHSDWKEETDIMLKEFTSIRDALVKGDINEIGRIRSEHLRGNLNRMSRYISKH